MLVVVGFLARRPGSLWRGSAPSFTGGGSLGGFGAGGTTATGGHLGPSARRPRPGPFRRPTSRTYHEGA